MDVKKINLGDKVNYMRIDSTQGQPDQLFLSEGRVVGIVLDPSRRYQVNVRDTAAVRNEAYGVEPYCINPTDAEQIEYFAHRQKVNDVAKAANDKINAVRAEMIAAGNKEVDDLNESLFGPPVYEEDETTKH